MGGRKALPKATLPELCGRLDYPHSASKEARRDTTLRAHTKEAYNNWLRSGNAIPTDDRQLLEAQKCARKFLAEKGNLLWPANTSHLLTWKEDRDELGIPSSK